MRSPASDCILAVSFTIGLALAIVLNAGPSYAGMESEIEHLLRAIETSGYRFQRNGNMHDAQQAGEHIRKKYAHAKHRITSSEDFIRYAATRSSITGRPYQVTCDGVEMPTAEWLMLVLARFREDTR